MDSKIKGVESGTDDFITKPPNPLELQARAKVPDQDQTPQHDLINIEKEEALDILKEAGDKGELVRMSAMH